jgi:hypothetical protein
MPLIRCSDQRRETLTQFYTAGDDEQVLKAGAAMLSIIDLLNAKFIETKLYGLTSLYSLNLLPEDTYKSPWYVSFTTDGTRFHIDYLVPESRQPWPNARVSGEAETIEQAIEFIVIAMAKSEGWVGNKELEKLLAGI